MSLPNEVSEVDVVLLWCAQKAQDDSHETVVQQPECSLAPHLQGVGHQEVAIPATQGQGDAVGQGGAAVQGVRQHCLHPPRRHLAGCPVPVP